MLEYTAAQGWPLKSHDLLLRAACGDTQAWEQWSREFGLDRASWSEVRLLASVAKVIPEARLQGIRRFVWVRTQMQLLPVVAALQNLERAGIELLLLKGAARIAVDPTAAAERLVRDVDVLVPVVQAEQALSLLQDDGWALSGWQQRLREVHPISSHHAWAVTRGTGELDLHHFSNFLNRDEHADDGMWSRATQVEWRGLRVRVPSATDGLLLAILHGVRWSQERASDWVLDAVGYLREGVQWDTLEQEARDRQVESIVHAGLTYLRDRLCCVVPESTIMALAVTDPESAQRLFFYAYVAQLPVDVGLDEGSKFT